MDGHHLNSAEHDILAAAGIERIVAERLGQSRIIIQSVFNEIRPDGHGALRMDFLLSDDHTETTLWIDEKMRQPFNEKQIALIGQIACAHPKVNRSDLKWAS